MECKIQYKVNDVDAKVEFRGCLPLTVSSYHDSRFAAPRKNLMGHIELMLNSVPEFSKFLLADLDVRIYEDKSSEKLNFVCRGFKAYKVKDLELFLRKFSDIYLTEACRRSVFDLVHGK